MSGLLNLNLKKKKKRKKIIIDPENRHAEKGMEGYIVIE